MVPFAATVHMRVKLLFQNLMLLNLCNTIKFDLDHSNRTSKKSVYYNLYYCKFIDFDIFCSSFNSCKSYCKSSILRSCRHALYTYGYLINYSNDCFSKKTKTQNPFSVPK